MLILKTNLNSKSVFFNIFVCKDLMKIKFKKFIFDNVLYFTCVHKSLKVVLQRGVCYNMPIFFKFNLENVNLRAIAAQFYIKCH